MKRVIDNDRIAVCIGRVLAMSAELWFLFVLGAVSPTARAQQGSTTAQAPPTGISEAKKAVVENSGDTFESHECRSPTRQDEFQLLWKNDDASIKCIELDLGAKKIYWIDRLGSRSSGSIRRANLNGSNIETLVSRISEPRGLRLDTAAGKMYWADTGMEAGVEKAVRRCNLDGTGQEVLIRGIDGVSDLLLDVPHGYLFLCGEYKIWRYSLDGTSEKLICKLPSSNGSPGHMVMAPTGDRLYWTAANQAVPPTLYSADLEGKDLRLDMSLPFGTHMGGAVIAPESKKIYWADTSYGNVRRANLDGSECELLIDGLHGPSKVALDPEAKMLYFADNRGFRSGGHRLNRIPIAPESVKRTLKSPPEIVEFVPNRAKAGQQVQINGNGMTDVTKVIFIDGASGKHVSAVFTSTSNSMLSVTVPVLSQACRTSTILLQSTGGVSIALPPDANVIEGENEIEHHENNGQAIHLVRGKQGSPRNRGRLNGADNAVVVVQNGGSVSLGKRGGATVFVENGGGLALSGSGGNVVYHEPFAFIVLQQLRSKDTTFVPAPKIRTCIVPERFSYTVE